MCGCKVFLLNKTSQVGPKVLNVLEASRPEDIFATTTHHQKAKITTKRKKFHYHISVFPHFHIDIAKYLPDHNIWLHLFPFLFVCDLTNTFPRFPRCCIIVQLNAKIDFEKFQQLHVCIFTVAHLLFRQSTRSQ